MPSNAQEFRLIRREAERRAREEAWLCSGAEEITLEQIYACLQNILPDLDVGYAMQEELAVERAVCVVNPDIKAFYDDLQREGANVAFVSDTYLPIAFIKDVMKSAGYEGRHALFVSSESLATKYRGTLFTQVAAALGVSPARILHIGDNVRSDYRNGRRAGIRSYWYRRTVLPVIARKRRYKPGS